VRPLSIRPGTCATFPLALKPGELHDFHELMSDYADTVGENWYSDAFDELKAQGHLDPASGKAMGPRMQGRLSADGRAVSSFA
jgi:hypothetical protein